MATVTVSILPLVARAPIPWESTTSIAEAAVAVGDRSRHLLTHAAAKVSTIAPANPSSRHPSKDSPNSLKSHDPRKKATGAVKEVDAMSLREGSQDSWYGRSSSHKGQRGGSKENF